MKYLLVLFATKLLLLFSIQAQIIDDLNRTDWSIAGLNNTLQTTAVVNVTNVYNLAGDGITDDATKIQNAVNLAIPGSVLYFEPGNYLMRKNLVLPSNIILRGESASTTFFKFDLSGLANPDIDCIFITTYQYGNYVDAVSGFNKGSTAVKVANTSGFSVGSYAEIQQDNDAAIMYTSALWDVAWAEDAVGQMLKIIDIKQDTLFFWPPLNMGFRADLFPIIRSTQLKENVGIENLYIERLDRGEGNTIIFANTANCWVWNAESKKTVKSHIWALQSLNLQIQDNFFHQSHDYGGGGHGYGVTLGRHTTNCLVENNIFKTLRHAMMVKEGANGNVIGYNYSINPVWTNWFSIPADISVHGHYPFMNLFEGNIVQKVGCTDYWGPAGPGNTFFRNRVETVNLSIEDYSHFQNVVGNEITGGFNRIFIESTVNNTLQHGNNDNGTISWTAGITNQLPNSYYLNGYWAEDSFPFIGPEFTLNSGQNTAKNRYDDGAFNNCYTGRTQQFTNAVIPDNTYMHLNDSIATNGTVTVNTGTTVALKAVNRISLSSGFSVKAGAGFKAAISECY